MKRYLFNRIAGVVLGCMFLLMGEARSERVKGWLTSKDSLIELKKSHFSDSLIRILPYGNDNYETTNKLDLANPNDVVRRVSSHIVLVSYRLETGSNAIPLSLAGKFALGGYITPAQTAQTFEQLSSINRAGAIQDFNLLLFPTAGVSKSVPNSNGTKIVKFTGLYYVNQTHFGVNLTQDAFGLFMRGNTPFLGQILNVGDNQFRSLRTHALRFNFDIKSKNYRPFNGRSYLLGQFSMGQVLNYNSSGTRDMNLYSSNTGDSLNFNGSVYNQSTASDKVSNGWGMQFGFVWGVNSKTTKSSFQIILRDFGFWSINNVNTWSRGVQWSNNSLNAVSWDKPANLGITAVNLGTSDLRFSNWFDRQKDTLEAKIEFKEYKQRGTILSPFYVRLGYTYNSINTSGEYRKLQVNHSFALVYRHWLGYLPKFEYYAHIKPSRNYKFTWSPGVSFGGFDVFDVNFNGRYFINKVIKRNRIQTSVNLDLNGIESFIMPQKYHGGGAYLSFTFPFDVR